MENRTTNETPNRDEMLKRIFQNQRTIIEQNAKIIREQEKRQADENDQRRTTIQVPPFVKVCQYKLLSLNTNDPPEY